MEIVVRALVVYVLLFVILRAMGKRERSQRTAFELVLLVTIGDVVQQGVTQEDKSITGAVLAVGTMVCLVVATSVVAARWPGGAAVLDGVPVVGFGTGTSSSRPWGSERLTIDEIQEAARRQGIGDLSTVELCVLEPDGSLSFLTGARHGDGSSTSAATA